MSIKIEREELSTCTDNSIGMENDPRWKFVQEIVRSPLFVKSERLSRFLLFICSMSLQGRDTEINEQSIGKKVFGRDISYDSANDGIVRSHAVRLRERLTMYFAQSGQNVPYLLEIPKGAYLPVFIKQEPPLVAADSRAGASQKLQEETGLPLAVPHSEVSTEDDQAPGKHRARGKLLWGSLAATILGASLCWTLATGIYLLTHTSNRNQIWNSVSGSHHPLWNRLFNRDIDTQILLSDTGTVISEIYSDHHVALSEYAANHYTPKLPLVTIPPSYHQAALDNLRYTGLLDVTLIQRIYSLPGLDLSRTTVRYARDIHLNDLKGRNLVILGANGSNPWVELYEQKMNFYCRVEPDQAHSGAFINRRPRANEPAVFDTDPTGSIYALAAYQPGLDGKGDVLILEGQGMAASESAVDFVLDDNRFPPFLSQIRRPDGTIPYFEVLIKTTSLNGDDPQFEVVTYRVD